MNNIRNKIDEFIDVMIDIINSVRSGIDFSELKDNKTRFCELHNYFIKNIPFFYSELLNILDGDKKLYCLAMSTIYEVTKDVHAVQVLENLLLDNEIDLYFADMIQIQISAVKFTDMSVPNSYEKNRNINKKLLERYIRTYPIPYEYTPYKERNLKRIVIETNSLLGIHHGPTRIVLELCKCLQNDYGYDVFLLVNRTSSNAEDLLEFWTIPFMYNYTKEMEGRFELDYEGTIISGYQFEWSRLKLKERNIALQIIHDWKPLCVFHICGEYYRHDIYKYLTTQLSMPCEDGYAASEAQVLVSYMKSDAEYVQEAVKYIKNQNQCMEDIAVFGGLKKDHNRNYIKEYFGIPEKSFAICLVGNRLDSEISPEFENLLKRVIERHPYVYVAIIGKMHRNLHLQENRVIKLGYQMELIDVLKVMDLYVNPVRKGGGGSASCALQAGVPVVSLINCDVAVNVGENFVCDDLQKMEQLIERYIEDNEFYNNQIEKVKAWYMERKQVDRGEIFNDLLERVKLDIEEGRCN